MKSDWQAIAHAYDAAGRFEADKLVQYLAKQVALCTHVWAASRGDLRCYSDECKSCHWVQLLALLTVDSSTDITDAMIDRLLHESGPTSCPHS
jgi:hypothetical protein